MDFDRALDLLAEDVEYTNIPILTVHGHAGVRAVVEPFFEPIHRETSSWSSARQRPARSPSSSAWTATASTTGGGSSP